mgnify:CR=1 FL=1
METILLHRLGHLTVDAAQWILPFLDMQLHKSLIHQITIVLSPCMRLLDTRIQIRYQIRDGTALHRFIPLEDNPLAGGWIKDREIADIGMVTTLLRTDIWIIFILHVRLVLADKSRRMTIYVVLFRTSTIILELRESSRHLQLQTESEQIGNLNLLVGSHLLGNIHLARSTDVIAELSLQAYRRELSTPYANRHSQCADLHIRVSFLHLHSCRLTPLISTGLRSPATGRS